MIKSNFDNISHEWAALILQVNFIIKAESGIPDLIENHTDITIMTH